MASQEKMVSQVLQDLVAILEVQDLLDLKVKPAILEIMVALEL